MHHFMKISTQVDNTNVDILIMFVLNKGRTTAYTDSHCDSVCYRVPSGTWKSGDLNITCPGLEIAWNLSQKVRKPGQNKKFSRKPG